MNFGGHGEGFAVNVERGVAVVVAAVVTVRVYVARM